MKRLLPFILIGASVWMYFGYISPSYDNVKVVRAERDQYAEALAKARDAEKIKEALVTKYNSITSEELARLQTMLPDTVDPVRLVIDVSSIAAKYGMAPKKIKVTSEPQSQSGNGTAPLGPDVGLNVFAPVTLQFSVNGTYENFIQFIETLESSLRVIDVKEISFTSPALRSRTTDYTINLTVYRLK